MFNFFYDKAIIEHLKFIFSVGNISLKTIFEDVDTPQIVSFASGVCPEICAIKDILDTINKKFALTAVEIDPRALRNIVLQKNNPNYRDYASKVLNMLKDNNKQIILGDASNIKTFIQNGVKKGSVDLAIFRHPILFTDEKNILRSFMKMFSDVVPSLLKSNGKIIITCPSAQEFEIIQEIFKETNFSYQESNSTYGYMGYSREFIFDKYVGYFTYTQDAYKKVIENINTYLIKYEKLTANNSIIEKANSAEFSKLFHRLFKQIKIQYKKIGLLKKYEQFEKDNLLDAKELLSINHQLTLYYNLENQLKFSFYEAKINYFYRNYNEAFSIYGAIISNILKSSELKGYTTKELLDENIIFKPKNTLSETEKNFYVLARYELLNIAFNYINLKNYNSEIIPNSAAREPYEKDFIKQEIYLVEKILKEINEIDYSCKTISNSMLQNLNTLIESFKPKIKFYSNNKTAYYKDIAKFLIEDKEQELKKLLLLNKFLYPFDKALLNLTIFSEGKQSEIKLNNKCIQLLAREFNFEFNNISHNILTRNFLLQSQLHILNTQKQLLSLTEREINQKNRLENTFLQNVHKNSISKFVANKK